MTAKFLFEGNLTDRKWLKSMDTVIHIPKEEDIRRWVKESIKEFYEERDNEPNNLLEPDDLISRVAVAKMLEISLVTLNSWTKLGLPCYKNQGRVYFLKSEVLDYLKKKGKGKTEVNRNL